MSFYAFYPASIVKMSVGEGDELPTRVGAVSLTSSEEQMSIAVLDSRDGFAYFWERDNGRLVKVELGAGANAPVRIGALQLTGEEGALYRGVVDEASNVGLFVGGTSVPRVVKVGLGRGRNIPARLGGIELDNIGSIPTSAVIDSEAGYGYFGSNTVPGRIVKVAYSQKGFARFSSFSMAETGNAGTIHFFSHTPSGSLRLSIYDNAEPKRLLWQSDSVPNTGDNAEVVVPIADGAPSRLRLEAGTYWLAWQTDSTADIGSYTPGAQGDGFYFPMEYGPAPESLAAAAITPTSEIWTEYITYAPATESDVVDFAFVPSGTFTMGRADGGDDALGGRDELPRHEVALDAFEIAETEITNAQYVDVLNWALGEGLLENRDGEAYGGGYVYRRGRLLVKVGRGSGEGTGESMSTSRSMRGNESKSESESKSLGIVFGDGAFWAATRDAADGPVSATEHPVVNVTWHGAAAFCNFLAMKEGRPVAYDWETWELVQSEKGDGVNTYRLPTEAEWERAAAWDGERHFVYGFGADDITTTRANFKPKGAPPANPLGLLDEPFTSPAGWYDGENTGTEPGLSPVGAFGMSGNAAEWCQDRYSSRYYAASAASNPVGGTAASHRAVRGGGWNSKPGDCRSANRHDLRPAKARDDVGFRIVAVASDGSDQSDRSVRLNDPGAARPSPSPTPTPTPTPVAGR